jgi:hypothetical protein
MKICLCEDCARPLTVEEIHYYGRADGEGGRCEDCERAWGARIEAWRTGKSEEPELDAMFRAPKPWQWDN